MCLSNIYTSVGLVDLLDVKTVNDYYQILNEDRCVSLIDYY